MLVNQGSVPAKRSLHAMAGVAEPGGELIVKVINTSASPCTAQLALPQVERWSSPLKVTTLTSARPADNNSLDEPFKVVPSTLEAQPPLSVRSTFDFPANSLTVIRVPPAR